MTNLIFWTKFNKYDIVWIILNYLSYVLCIIVFDILRYSA